MDVCYHMVPRSYFESLDSSQDYLPENFSKDGFIHCTDGEYMLSFVANNIYQNVQGEMLVLFLERSKIKSPTRYDDSEKLFPHIYGPLNRDAIVKISKMSKDSKGDWIFPISEAL